MAPLFLWPLVIELLYPGQIDQLIVGGALALGRALTQSFGIAAIVVSAGVLAQANGMTFSPKAYWRAVLTCVAVLSLPYLALFAYTALRLGSNFLAPFNHRASALDSAILLLIVLVAMIASAWLYLYFRRDLDDTVERFRWLFLLVASIALAFGFFHHLWQGILMLTSEGSNEPGYPYKALASWISTLIGSLFTAFGLAFLFGLPAIHVLKRTNREHDLLASIFAMVIAAFGIWVAAYGLSLLSISLIIGDLPDWAYWPTQEAVIALALMPVGGLIAGFLYPRIVRS
jgi:hypothetical protein